MACPLLMIAIMMSLPSIHAVAVSVGERVGAATWSLRTSAELVTGMSIMAFVFTIAQLLLFIEELWWRL